MLDNLSFPLHFEFKLLAVHPQFQVTDAQFQPIAFVKKKAFKFKEEISVYRTSQQQELRYQINADQWIDWSASYKFTEPNGRVLGRITRKGARSMFKAHYELFDSQDQQDLIIEEESFFVRFMDGLLGEIPILNFFTGYFFNPTYLITRPDGTLVAKFRKEQSMVGRKFSVSKEAPFEEGEEARIVLGLMMMVQLERSRG